MSDIKDSENSFVVDQTEIAKDTGNVYESIVAISKRANQISSDLKGEIDSKVKEFLPLQKVDSIHEDVENPERIALSRHYERNKKPCLMAVKDWLGGRVSTAYQESKEETGDK